MKTEVGTPAAWGEPLSAYLSWMRGIRRAEGTIYQHSYQLRRFATAVAVPPWPMTLAQLGAYMGTLDHDLGASARRTVRQAIRGFYGWGHLTGRSSDNPAEHIPNIRTERGVPRPAPEHSVLLGLRARDPRSRLMVLLGARLGLRCREICQVHTRDLLQDLVGWSLLVHGKGDKDRLVPVPDDVRLAIQAQDDGFLFPGQIDGHLSPAYVSKQISAALPPGVTAHQLRHRYATRAYQLGGRDLRAVQKLLGHAYSTTTEIYVATDDDAVRRAALAAAS